MKVVLLPTASAATAAAAARLEEWFGMPGTRNVMLAGGNTPLDLYRRIADRRPAVSHLNLFALDEYVGVPADEPRNCANFLRRAAVEPWRLPPSQFFPVSSLEEKALESIREHERRIESLGGLDVAVLGLGQNGHLGFNEPGSQPDSIGRVVDLEPLSIEANRQWFDGAYAPVCGVTVGLKTILAARHILIMAYGAHKTAAVKRMLEEVPSERCPASFLQSHPDVHLFLDPAAAARLSNRAGL